MTSGGQKPVLVFTHRRDATLLLVTFQQCTSRTKPRFFQNIRLPQAPVRSENTWVLYGKTNENVLGLGSTQ